MVVHRFDRDRIVELLGELGRRLARKGVSAQIFVVGGSAIAMAYDSRRVTADIDAIFKPVDEVQDEVAQMAVDLRLPQGWLNNAVADTVAGVSADAEPRDLFSVDGVQVSVASPRYILALKAMIHGRELERDYEDAALLCNMLDITREQQLEDIVRTYFGRDLALGVQELRFERIIDKARARRKAIPPATLPSVDATQPGASAQSMCGHWMRNARRTCRLPVGHAGQHR